MRPERATWTRPVCRSDRAASRPTRPGLQRVCQSKRHHPRPRWNGVATARGALQMVRAGGQRRSLAWRCPVLPFHEPMLVCRPALRRHRHFPAAKAGTTKSPLLVIKCAAGIVASPQGRGNRRSVGTPWKTSLHRTRWNASLQGRTAWKSSLHLEDWQFQAESSAARCLWRAGFHPGPCPGAAATHRTPCAAATPHGAFDFAKRLECASLLALSKLRSTTGDLPPQPCFPQPTGISGDPSTHTVEGPVPPRPWGGGPEQAASA